MPFKEFHYQGREEMADINTVNLLGRMQEMAQQASGESAIHGASGATFASCIQDALSQLNSVQASSDALKTRFEQGDPAVSLADVMVETQKSNIAFEGGLRVRNKLTEFYQRIMDMPL